MAGNSPPVPPTREQILASPAMHAPSGITPDFEHPWSMFYNAIRILISIYLISTIVVIVRIYERLRIARTFFREDYVIILAWLVHTAAFMPVGVRLDYAPMGVHQWNITVRQLENYLFYQYVGFIVWIILTLLLKIAILLQYLRIFVPDGIRGFTFWASHVVLWANVTYYTAFVFTFLFVCNPRPFFWDKTIAHGKCLDIFGINIIGAVFCLASDLIILLLPQRVIFRLTLSRTRKLSLAFLFAVGIFACITSAVRLYYNVRLWKNQTDVTYQLGFISLWGTVQLAAGFWIVCSPSIPKTINHFRRKPWFLRVETSLRSRLRKGHPKTEEGDLAENPTIGGERNQRAGREVVTDVEFHELVNKTEASVASRADSGPV